MTRKLPARWAVQWRYRTSTRWVRLTTYPNEATARAKMPPDTEARVYRAVITRRKSAIPAAKRARRNLRSVKRDLWNTARAFVMLRDGGACVRCGEAAHEAHHIVGSRRLRTRFDPENLLAMCRDCHKWWHSHPVAGHAWFRDRWPDRHQYLMRLEGEFGSLSDKAATSRIRREMESTTTGPARGTGVDG